MNTIDLDQHRKDGRAPEWSAARRTLARAAPPERVEAELLRAFARRQRRPWYRRCSLDAVASWAGAGALTLALAVVGLSPGAAWRGAGHGGADGGFLSLVPAERIAQAAHPQLRRADLPRQVLVRLGIPIAADAPDELIHAEMLVAATGEPLAIRLAVN